MPRAKKTLFAVLAGGKRYKAKRERLPEVPVSIDGLLRNSRDQKLGLLDFGGVLQDALHEPAYLRRLARGEFE